MHDKIHTGDLIEVHIKNDCPLGGDTQVATFTVKEKHINKIVGVDETWGDECVVSGFGTDTLDYQDGGKSGEVAKVNVMDTDDHGNPIIGSGEQIA